jgi:hypothetical protein
MLCGTMDRKPTKETQKFFSFRKNKNKYELRLKPKIEFTKTYSSPIEPGFNGLEWFDTYKLAAPNGQSMKIRLFDDAHIEGLIY